MTKNIDEWAREHGTQQSYTLRSNAHHLLSPVIGWMRLIEAGHMELTQDAAGYIADRLSLLIALVDNDDRVG